MVLFIATGWSLLGFTNRFSLKSILIALVVVVVVIVVILVVVVVVLARLLSVCWLLLYITDVDDANCDVGSDESDSDDDGNDERRNCKSLLYSNEGFLMKSSRVKK